jgi:hypothetical protein
MPVLRIAIVTSPGFNSSPFCTTSTLGAASATQRSCFGFVNTPMLLFAACAAPAAPPLVDAGLILPVDVCSCMRGASSDSRNVCNIRC